MRGRTSIRASRVIAGAASVIMLATSLGLVTSLNQPVTTDVRLTQNEQTSLVVGEKVNIDLKKVVEQRLGKKVLPGATLRLTGLPPGLRQDGWRIVGTPTRSGLYAVRVEVTAAGKTSGRDVQLMVAAPQGEKPGGVITRPGDNKPKPSAEPKPSTTAPRPTTSASATPSATPGEATSTTVSTTPSATPSHTAPTTATTTTSDVAPSTTPEVEETSTVPTSAVPAPGMGSLKSGNTGGGQESCDSSQLTSLLESVLPLAMGDAPGAADGAKMIADLLGSLLPSLLATASAGNDMVCGANPATGSLIDGAETLGQVTQGSGAQGTQGAEVAPGATGNALQPGADSGTPDTSALSRAVALANSILANPAP